MASIGGLLVSLFKPAGTLSSFLRGKSREVATTNKAGHQAGQQVTKPVSGPTRTLGSTRSRYDAYHAGVGIPGHLLRQAEVNAAYVAIYIGWVRDEPGFMLGTTKSPREVPKDLCRYNKRPTETLLLWTASQEIADRVLGVLREEIKPFFLHGSWYDELPHENAVLAIRDIARRGSVWIASTEERNQMLAEACARAIKEHRQVQSQTENRTGKGEVVPFGHGR